MTVPSFSVITNLLFEIKIPKKWNIRNKVGKYKSVYNLYISVICGVWCSDCKCKSALEKRCYCIYVGHSICIIPKFSSINWITYLNSFPFILFPYLLTPAAIPSSYLSPFHKIKVAMELFYVFLPCHKLISTSEFLSSSWSLYCILGGAVTLSHLRI
jgi:hypothetical protein